MTPRQPLTRTTRAFVAGVIALGTAAAVWQIARIDPTTGGWSALAVLGGLGALAPLTSVRYVGKLPTGVVHQVSSTFIYAMMGVADPGMACLAILGITAADQFVFRRRAVNTLFNLGNLWLSLGAATAVRFALAPENSLITGANGRDLAVAAASMLTFAGVNHSLTITVVNLVNRTPVMLYKWITKAGLYNEAQCIVSGIAMAIFWTLHPALALLVAVPVYGVSLLLGRLASREDHLEVSAARLQSLQNLGLEIGRELDEERLLASITRITRQAVEASASLIALRDGSDEGLRVAAHVGLETDPPARLDDEASPERLEVDATCLHEAGSLPAYLEFVHPRPESALCATLTIQDRAAGVLVLLHDATRRPFDEEDRSRIETLMQFVNVALSNARGVAERTEMESRLRQSEKLSALGIMVSGVAHELNNPLTSIMGYAELLAPRESDEKRRRMLERIGQESRRAGKIVQSLLTFSRNHKPERTFVDLNAICDELAEFRGYELRVRNIDLRLRLSPDLPSLWADPHQLQQVLINLVNNAEQAIGDSGRGGTITIETRRRGEVVELRVEDDGPGMPEEVADRAFLPFFTTKDVGRGTGLGLSICFGIVEEHGGHIDVESSLHGGTRFRIGLPVATDRRADRATPYAPVAPPAADFRGRILVVDDESAILQVLTDFFQSAGWTVVTARNGEEALEAADTSDFDVLVVDVRMPGMDGRSFYEWLEQLRPDLLPRVIFTTGDTGSPRTLEFLERLENAVVTKPYNLAELNRVVGGVLQSPRGDAGEPGIH